VALDTLLLRGLNKKIADVKPIRKGRINPAYQLRAQLIVPRREHLKLLGLERKAKVVSLEEILTQPDNTPANSNAANER
jgi:hypothetical protein